MSYAHLVKKTAAALALTLALGAPAVMAYEGMGKGGECPGCPGGGGGGDWAKEYGAKLSADQLKTYWTMHKEYQEKVGPLKTEMSVKHAEYMLKKVDAGADKAAVEAAEKAYETAKNKVDEAKKRFSEDVKKALNVGEKKSI